MRPPKLPAVAALLCATLLPPVSTLAQAQPAQTPTQTATQTVTVTDAAGFASETRVKPGDTLVVRLKAAAAPGNAWTLDQNNILLLRALSPDAKGDTEAGVQTFRFEVVGIGSEELSFQYGDADTPDTNASRFFRTLLVSEPPAAKRGKLDNSVVRVTDADSGRRIPLRVGDTLALHLPVSTGSGFVWEIGLNNATLLKPASATGERFADVANGGSQYQDFSFTASEAGSEQLQMFERRGAGQPGQTFALQVFVSDADGGKDTKAGKKPTPQKPTLLGERDNGRDKTFRAGDVIEIRLPSNPSTGFGWQITGSAPGITPQSGTPTFESDKHAPSMAGGGGTQVFRFAASGAGRGTLRLSYRRSWEKKAAAKSWEVRYRVVKP